MIYEVIPTHFFLTQLDDLSQKALTIIEEKIQFLKANPARFRKIEGYPYNLFRIRFVDYNQSKRLICSIDGKYVKLLCIINRKNNYKDLTKYLENIKKNNEL